MGYVGNQQTEGFSQVPAKQDLTGATGTSLTLTHAVASAEGIDLFINNVRQEPTEAYSVVGTAVTLTGSVVATDDIYVVYNSLARQTSTHPSNQALQATSGSFSGGLTLTSTNADANSGPQLDFYRNSASPADNDILGALLYTGKSSTGADKTYSSINGFISNVANANASGGIIFNTRNSDTLAERMRIDSSGNVVLNNASHLQFKDSGGTARDVLAIDAYNGLNINSAGGGSAAPIVFKANNTETMRIDSSGKLLINRTTGLSNGRLEINGGTAEGMSIQGGSNNYIVSWHNTSGTLIGSITGSSGSSTSYNTTSDYRLKTAVNYDWDATTRLKQLRPARFEWIADGDDAVPVDGFLAHEVQDIVPEAISGTKDAVDEDGNPEYQGIDQSKLVPLLVKTIQELEARITALEAS